MAWLYALFVDDVDIMDKLDDSLSYGFSLPAFAARLKAVPRYLQRLKAQK